MGRRRRHGKAPLDRAPPTLVSRGSALTYSKQTTPCQSDQNLSLIHIFSLNRSSELNDSYRTLREPISRVEYLLLRRGLRKEGTTKQQAPPELLEEVFELNESLDELREARAEGGDLAALREPLDAAQKNFRQKLEEVDAELAGIAREWDFALDTAADEAKKQTLLARMNEVLNRRSYIRNLVAGVQKELAEA